MKKLPKKDPFPDQYVLTRKNLRQLLGMKGKQLTAFLSQEGFPAGWSLTRNKTKTGRPKWVRWHKRLVYEWLDAQPKD